jgi:hypothetical protein
MHKTYSKYRGADLILWALPEDLVEKMGLDGYIVPIEPETNNLFGQMVQGLMTHHGVENRNMVTCLVPGTNTPEDFDTIDGHELTFLNIINPDMYNGDVCESFFIHAESDDGNEKISFRIFVTWQPVDTGPIEIEIPLRHYRNVLVDKYASTLVEIDWDQAWDEFGGAVR